MGVTPAPSPQWRAFSSPQFEWNHCPCAFVYVYRLAKLMDPL